MDAKQKSYVLSSELMTYCQELRDRAQKIIEMLSTLNSATHERDESSIDTKNSSDREMLRYKALLRADIEVINAIMVDVTLSLESIEQVLNEIVFGDATKGEEQKDYSHIDLEVDTQVKWNRILMSLEASLITAQAYKTHFVLAELFRNTSEFIKDRSSSDHPISLADLLKECDIDIDKLYEPINNGYPVKSIFGMLTVDQMVKLNGAMGKSQLITPDLASN